MFHTNEMKVLRYSRANKADRERTGIIQGGVVFILMQHRNKPEDIYHRTTVRQTK